MTPHFQQTLQRQMNKLHGWVNQPLVGPVSLLGVAVIIVSITSLLMLLKISLVPLIPREGDAFGCWYNYVPNLRAGGLALALRNADATGRYPGYPSFLLLLNLAGVNDYLQALQLGRVIANGLSFLGLFLLLRQLGIRFMYAIAACSFVHLIPSFGGAIAINTQDSLKPAFFVFSAYFLLRITAIQPAFLKMRFWCNFLGFLFFSIALASLRSVELFPLYAFLMALEWHYYRDLKTFMRNVLLKPMPSFLFVVLLHVYGHRVVGHWGLSSNGSPPQTWVGMLRGELNANFPDFGFARLAHLAQWTIVGTLNKVAYFIDDFIFQKAVLRIVGAYTFVKRLDLSLGAHSYVLLALAILLLVGLFVRILMDFKIKKLSTVFLWASVAAAGFYMFGLNHYEPRYWLLVFLPLVISGTISLEASRWATLIMLLCSALIIPINLEKIKNATILGDSLSQQAATWEETFKTYCAQGELKFELPYDFYEWSSIRYFAHKACPGSVVTYYSEGQNSPPASVLRLEAQHLKWLLSHEGLFWPK